MQKTATHHPSVLLAICGQPKSACAAQQLQLQMNSLAEWGVLQAVVGQARVDQAGGADRKLSAASFLREFLRMVPGCDVVHLYLADREALNLSLVLTGLVARFFGKALLVDLRDCLDGLDRDSLPPALRATLALSHTVVIPEHSIAARLARPGLTLREIPAALADRDFVDRSISRLQPKIAAVLPRGDQAAANCLVKAYQLVKNKYPRTEMTIIGDSGEHESCCRDEHGWIAGDVEFVAAEDGDETKRCLAEADVFVNPCPLGGRRSILKAMATGLPVLAAADNGRAGPVIDGRNGLTYRWNDPGSLAARIIELTESPPLVSSLSSAGRRTADAHRWTEISRSWFECYRSLRPAAATSTGASRPDRRPRVTVPTTTLPK